MLKQVGLLCCLLAGAMSMPLGYSDKHSGNGNESAEEDVEWDDTGDIAGDDIGDIAGDDIGDIAPRNVQRWGWWKGGIVPYEFTPGIGGQEIQVILTAMRTIENVMPPEGGCQLRFVPREQWHRDFIYFQNPGVWMKCWSWFGERGGPQELLLGPGCFQVPTVIHELLHTLGFAHQQASPNRDEHINIHLENIKDEEQYNFNKESYEKFTDFGLPYDYKSIMHYHPYSHVKQGARGPSISSKDPNVQLGHNLQLSDIDIKKLHIMYCKKGSETPIDKTPIYETPTKPQVIEYVVYNY